jgi:predicted O-methyltransferase YrrM
MDIKNYLKNYFFSSNLNKFNHYITIDGWLTETEAKGLRDIAAMLPINSQIVEIGSWKGKSTWCISQGLKKGIINCIDPFNAAGEEGSKVIYEKTKGPKSLIEQFNNNLVGVTSNVKIKTLQGYSSDFVGTVKNIDFLFIDGDHSIEGCKYDFENFEQDVKPGGYIAFHDYYFDRPELGPTWVIENLVKNDEAYSHYMDCDSLSIFKKKA